MAAPIVVLRAGMTDPATLEAQDIDPQTGAAAVVNLTNFGLLRLLLYPDPDDGSDRLIYRSDDAQPVIAYGTRSDGELVIQPLATTFTLARRYVGYFEATNGAGVTIPFPADRDLKVIILRGA